MVTLRRPHCALIRTPSDVVCFEHVQIARRRSAFYAIPQRLLAMPLRCCGDACDRTTRAPRRSASFFDAVGSPRERCSGVTEGLTKRHKFFLMREKQVDCPGNFGRFKLISEGFKPLSKMAF